VCKIDIQLEVIKSFRAPYVLFSQKPIVSQAKGKRVRYRTIDNRKNLAPPMRFSISLAVTCLHLRVISVKDVKEFLARLLYRGL
jgi:hypothetical protein